MKICLVPLFLFTVYSYTYRRPLSSAVVSLAKLRAMDDPRLVPMEGCLWRWSDMGHVSFCSGNMNSPNKLICIGGLTDGLLPCPWIPKLSARAKECGWCMVQPLISSSYSGYGTGSLDRDTTELNEFILQLKTQWNCQKVVFVGHSTGCQNSVHFAANGSEEVVALLTAIVLQAPVSDQEAGSLDPACVEYLPWAREQLEEKLDTLMPIESHFSPITIRRFLSLFENYGNDDYFSSYLTDIELRDRFKHIDSLDNLKDVVIAYSMADQYVPDHVDKSHLVDRIASAIGVKATPLKLQSADHSLYQPSDGSSIDTFVEAVISVLQKSVVDK
jgi:pimeloyl-ACP methyl ester carboxylesterase